LKGFLVLEDKSTYQGHWHGDTSLVAVGEVVFNTSMTGYQEIITDPSYFRQIVVMTTPEQGNYGVAKNERESNQVYAEGFVCVNLNEVLNSPRGSLKDELASFKRPGLSDIDTRALTLHLRERGTPWGALIVAPSEKEAQAKAAKIISEKKNSISQDWVHEVSVEKPEFHKGEGPGGRVGVLDLGTKNNIVGELKLRFQDVGVFGSRTPAETILDWAPDGLVLTNGPGDPAAVEGSVGEIKKLLGQIPIFGICMGHQLLALAAGGKTFKLKFGHRGANHPVKNLKTGEIYMTSQNHGYAVSEDLPAGVKVSQINLYDNTVEGIEIAAKRAWSVQYHPEASPGPHDSRVLFDHFANEVKK
jgi:carbamoyl-phosphate synthase small subunit